MEIDRTQELILIGIAITLVAILLLGIFANWLHKRTRKDAREGNKTLHDRMDRESKDGLYSGSRILSAIAGLRQDLITWWRRK